MKKLALIVTVMTAFMLIPGGILIAQETTALNVTEADICKAVVDRAPADTGNSFKADVGKLFCFIKITGAQDAVEITHVWYFGDVERAKVALPVKAAAWRTFSSKIIQPHEIGKWHVDVLGPDGNVLKTVEFEITQ